MILLTVASECSQRNHNIVRRDVVCLTGDISTQSPRDLVDELLGGESLGTSRISGALTVSEGVVQCLAQGLSELQQCLGVLHGLDIAVGVLHLQIRRMVQSTDESLDQTERIHAGLLTTLVSDPQISHSSVRSLELFDHDTILALADKIGGDETRRSVHLRDLVGEHVTVVVVRDHAEASLGPTNDLHGGGIRDQVSQLAIGDNASVNVLLPNNLNRNQRYNLQP